MRHHIEHVLCIHTVVKASAAGAYNRTISCLCNCIEWPREIYTPFFLPSPLSLPLCLLPPLTKLQDKKDPLLARANHLPAAIAGGQAKRNTTNVSMATNWTTLTRQPLSNATNYAPSHPQGQAKRVSEIISICTHVQELTCQDTMNMPAIL